MEDARDVGLSRHSFKWPKHLHIPDKLQSCIQPFKQAVTCIGGIVDSIAASQAVDPGSIPGQCSQVSCHTLVLVAEPTMDTGCNVPKFGSFHYAKRNHA